MQEVNPNIDWSVFDAYGDPASTCYCRCETVYRSHVKYLGEYKKVFSRVSCPGCGSNSNLKKVSSDPEYWLFENENNS